jgi:ferritin-like metal-binding protein YciE
MATSYSGDAAERARDLFIVGARNLHAVEKQALSIMSPQVARLEHYPQLADQLRLHIDETHGQVERLDQILADVGSGSSALKDLALSISGSMAAAIHSVAGDEVLKNSFANYAFEHFEIASYKSLITMAEDNGVTGAVSLLRTSLGEEQRMADWLDQALPMITRRYTELYANEGAMTAKV